ncbi:hypothetical protein B0H17DRAFT_1203718 [Mycena rosella]|uniref:Uncharacterized protein n=1 Tax=Mycena rosella TaxID=1033263 RepID=A0AAD7DB14_MYCRO|nr:hypothetical protein B0H17DRAFT_1203718 [Mycena rosella]
MTLIGAHSTGKQRFVSPAAVNVSFDSTVDVWDVRFYSETQSASAAPCTFRLNLGNQDDWDSATHEKMSLLGIDKNTFTDCTELLRLSINLKNLAVSSPSSGSGKAPTDPTIDPTKVEAAIQQYRST